MIKYDESLSYLYSWKLLNALTLKHSVEGQVPRLSMNVTCLNKALSKCH